MSCYIQHQKEWERLSGIPIEEQTYERNLEAVERIGATVVLKQHVRKSISAMMMSINYLLAHLLATGGMGDTAGMITSFVGQFDNFKEAVTSATYMHSFIGEKLSDTMYVVPPSRLLVKYRM